MQNWTEISCLVCLEQHSFFISQTVKFRINSLKNRNSLVVILSTDHLSPVWISYFLLFQAIKDNTTAGLCLWMTDNGGCCCSRAGSSFFSLWLIKANTSHVLEFPVSGEKRVS